MSMTPEQIVAAVEATYNAQDVDRIMALFHPEIIVFWNGHLRSRGIDELRRTHGRDIGHLQDYRIRKQLHAATSDALAVEWVANWTDPATDSEMESCGGEMWLLDGGLLREWHAYATVYQRTRGASEWTAVLLRPRTVTEELPQIFTAAQSEA